jgi:NADPH:quinone reductase-like Zn-dependent oxidoreductase
VTAHKLLTAFVDLKPGDWVAQNAANSAVSISSIRWMSMCDLKFRMVVWTGY